MSLIRSYLCDQLNAAILKSLGSEVVRAADITIEKPKQKQFGDYATPIAMTAAKKLRQPPPQVARAIMQHFIWDDRFVEADPMLTTTIAGGFINFKLSRNYLNTTLQSILISPQDFGRNQVTPQRILLEYVSANPTGPMVVVNGRAAAIGDVVARVNQYIGNQVETEFYVNDWGNQVELLGKSVAVRYRQKRGEEAVIPEGGYEGEYIAELGEEIAGQYPETAQKTGTELEQFFKTKALERNIQNQQTILKEYRTEFTRWFRESSLHASGSVTQTYEFLKSKGLTFEQDGAVWFKATAMGDERDRVIIRTDGTPTYILADIAYHAHKAARGYDESITFWGPDHHGHIPQLEKAVKALGIEKPLFKNLLIQQVNLIRDGQPFKMSKRKGDFVAISDLLSEVSVDAARYFFLMRKLSSHFDFDLSLAQKQGDENPVFYVQYAHARTCSLIAHALDLGYTIEQIITAPFSAITEPEGLECLKIISDFPEILLQTAQQIEPHRITLYCESLAASFHHFYSKHRVLGDDKVQSVARLQITMAVRNALRTALSVLGVTAPDRM